VRRDAVDADVPNDERPMSRTAKPRGPGAPMLASSSRRRFASRGRWWQESRSPGRARYKPSNHPRRGCRTASASPVCSCALSFALDARETAGASVHPAFPAPSSEKRRDKAHPSDAILRRENANAWPRRRCLTVKSDDAPHHAGTGWRV
jgi:hypothetical protein